MRFYTVLLFCLLTNLCYAQNEPLLFAEEMPRFPGCENEELTPPEKTECSNRQLLAYVYQNIVYPDSAVANNVEGSVVARFVVKADGTVGDVNIVRDIGHGCGAEAKRVIEKMNTDSMLWLPGKNQGVAQDIYQTLPIKFRIQPPPPDYVLIGRDTVYTKNHTPISYPDGHEVFIERIESALTYPPEWIDSCAVGIIACDILIRANGQAVILESYNYSSLPEDFIFDIIHHVARTSEQWTVATHTDQPVSAVYSARFQITPPNNACTQETKALDKSLSLGEEGIVLYNEKEQPEAALAKWDEAILTFPESVEFRMWRGAAHIQANNFEAACPDLKMVKAVLGNSGYDELLPLICREVEVPKVSNPH